MKHKIRDDAGFQWLDRWVVTVLHNGNKNHDAVNKKNVPLISQSDLDLAMVVDRCGTEHPPCR